jgi:HD-GYP domain-containing protein (c-di-GMP phosphodiesterase class II)
MLDRTILAQDLLDCRGALLGRKGLVVSAQAIAEAAARAPQAPRRLLSETFAAEDLHVPLADPPYRHLFRGPGVQSSVARALLSVRLPSSLYDELLALKFADPPRYRHGLTTAAVATRMLTAAVGETRVLPDMGAAGLLHDLGMRHLPPRLIRHAEVLGPDDAREVSAHPFLGAFHLACVLGSHPAVEAALSHHWRQGQGYPRLASPPSRSIEVVAVASAFAALTQARPFRSEAYDPRGAADLLIAEAAAGHADANTVKLLVHALRGGSGEARAIRFGRDRHGNAPVMNRHTPIAATERSTV